MTLIEPLTRLAEIAPGECEVLAPDDAYEIGEYRFMIHSNGEFSAGHPTTHGIFVTGRPALAWLRDTLEQVIEARGWEYTLCKFSHNYFTEIWSSEVVFERQATSAVEALLATLLAALEEGG